MPRAPIFKWAAGKIFATTHTGRWGEGESGDALACVRSRRAQSRCLLFCARRAGGSSHECSSGKQTLERGLPGARPSSYLAMLLASLTPAVVERLQRRLYGRPRCRTAG
mmetsp:Transcript_79059/g.221665  ORF Transcript_79059/g.221665 Transcript_79059/m.221665 type:complete len:109 (+) Transcript_79059:145-471(+)